MIIWSIVTPELILKATVSGLIGSIDSVILVFAYRSKLSGGRFYAMWAGLTALVHFVTKLIAGSLSSLPESLDITILCLVRLTALALAIWVVLISWKEINHIPQHVRKQCRKVPLNQRWSMERAHLWVPALLIGGLDGYPIGTIKGLLLNKPDLLKTVLSCSLGSLVVGLITLSVAYLVRRIESRLSPFHVGTLILGGILHLSIFTGISLAILIEWYYVLIDSAHTGLQIWITPILAASIMSVFVTWRHWPQWKKLMEEANRCDLP